MLGSHAARGLRGFRSAIPALVLAASLPLGGCVTAYVANTLHDMTPNDYHKPASPAPVQMLFSWQTKGTVNSRAQDLVGPEVNATVAASGLFSTVSKDPAPNGALLSITINNEPITSEGEAVGKGFLTGLTLGLAGSQVADGYTCTVDYYAAQGAPKLTHVTHQVILATIGAHTSPDAATKAASLKDAVLTITRRAVGNALKQLSDDPAFAH